LNKNKQEQGCPTFHKLHHKRAERGINFARSLFSLSVLLHMEKKSLIEKLPTLAAKNEEILC